MKILYIVSTLKRSGPTYQLLNTIKFLDRTVFNPVILTLSPEPKDSLIKEFKDLDIEIYSQDFGYNIFKLPILKNILNELNPNIIHSSGIRGDLFISLLKKYRNNTITTIHNNMTKDYIYRYGKLIGSIMIFIHIISLKKIKFPITCSESIREDYKRIFGFNTLAIPNGINENKFNKISSEEKKALKEKLQINSSSKVFISVGHLTKLKDPELICKAFIKTNKDNSILLFLGDGELLNKLKSKYSNSPNIIFLGRVTNVNEYLSVSDYYISASHTEGLPNSVLEAMASDLKVILSDIKPHKELVVNKAETDEFYLFETGNIKSLENVFNDIFEKKSCSKKSQGGNRKVIDLYYTAKIMSDKYQDLYKKIERDVSCE